MKPRIWFPHPILHEASHYLRSVFRRTVAAGKWQDLWPLLSTLYNLGEEQPREFARVLKDIAAPDALTRIETWADQQAKPNANMASYVILPDVDRIRDWLRRRVREHAEFEGIFTEDPATLLALAKGADMALGIRQHRERSRGQLPLPLLIFGPSGAGKELLAEALHHISQRNDRTPANGFGPLNCGGLPSQLIESELFGHKKDSFTGATKDRKGIIAEHKHGTVFLDEIGDTPAEVQVRLLRFLNNGEVRAIGRDTPEKVAPWVIAATHRDLLQLVHRGGFREDLYFRLRGDILSLPPLASRVGDLFPVITQCLRKHAAHPVDIEWTTAARAAVEMHPWPGNLREVDQLARALVLGVTAPRDRIRVDLGDLPQTIQVTYLSSRKMAAQMADLYQDTVTRYGQTGPELRTELVHVFTTGLRSGQIPGTGMAQFIERVVRSPFFAVIAGDQVALEAHAAAAHRRQEIVRTLASEFEQTLAKVDGVPMEAVDVVAVDPPPEGQLPRWVRHLLGIMGDGALRENELAAKVEALVAWVDTLSPGARAAIEAMFELLVRQAREEAPLDADTVPPGRSRASHTWEQVRDDRELFVRHQKAHGTARSMADALGVGERAVREAARRFKIRFPRGGARPGAGRPAQRATGKSTSGRANSKTTKR